MQALVSDQERQNPGSPIESLPFPHVLPAPCTNVLMELRLQAQHGEPKCALKQRGVYTITYTEIPEESVTPMNLYTTKITDAIPTKPIACIETIAVIVPLCASLVKRCSPKRSTCARMLRGLGLPLGTIRRHAQPVHPFPSAIVRVCDRPLSTVR